jgi:hypothetical protein
MIVAQFPPTLSTDYPNNINTNIRFEMNDVDIPSILISKDAKMACPNPRLRSLFVQLPNDSLIVYHLNLTSHYLFIDHPEDFLLFPDILPRTNRWTNKFNDEHNDL